MPVRVLVVHPRDIAEPSSGGIQTFLHDFISLSPTDFEISVAGVTADTNARPVAEWVDVQVGPRHARLLPMAPTGPLLRRPRASAGAIRKLRAEMRTAPILQVHRPYRPFVFRAHSGPRVQFIHLDLAHWRGPAGWPRLSWLYRDFSDRLELFDRVFVANEAGAHGLRARHPDLATRIEFLPGWYDADLYRPLSDHDRPHLRAALVRDLGLPASAIEERWILFVGRLEQVKDPLLAVETLAQLAPTDGPARLIVCGDGDMRIAMVKLAQVRGVGAAMTLIGHQPRAVVARLMSAADVLLVTSVSEGGGPRVVLEALGSGLPVVTTVVGEVRRTISGGANGWLAAERRPETLAAGLRWALGAPRDEVRDLATAAARPFAARVVLDRLYEAYRQLAAGRR